MATFSYSAARRGAATTGIDRVRAGTAQLVSRAMPDVERINLTLRRVTIPQR